MKKKNLLKKIQHLNDVVAAVKQKEAEYTSFIKAILDGLDGFGVDFSSLITLKTDYTEINRVLELEKASLEETKCRLGESEQDARLDGETVNHSLRDKLETQTNLLNLEKGKLDSEQQIFQAYVTAKDNWQKNKQELIGTSESPNTIKFFENELVYLKDVLPNQLAEKYEERREIVRNIFDKKQDVISVYKNARKKLNDIIYKNQETLKGYKIEVDASLVRSLDLIPTFLGFILQNKMGSFHSKDGGEKELNSLISEIDFDNKNSVIELLDKLINALKYDNRLGQNGEARDIAQQVKDLQGLYDYIFSLDFLTNNYQLKQGDKTLEQLSPGERGALLLVFYLLLDKNDIPLIIDQPEDNLDNHSVATILVPFIRAAKQKRQIIMVTHNPNLAVVSDAEQIIYVELNKENGYRFSTLSGSIEDEEVNNKIVEVLEGTMPAFNTRKRKYY